MNLTRKHLTTLFIITISSLLTAPAYSNEIDNVAISQWVAQTIGHTESFDLPTIHFVKKTDLGIAFKEGNENAYYRWEK